jgi:hypothetical protein
MDVLNRLQRELPDTDKDRYDIAYERGRAQARSSMLFGGLLLGTLLGAILMFLFDPVHGAGRRSQLASRATGIRNDVSRTASGRAEHLQNRAKGAMHDIGVAQPKDSANGTTGGKGDRQEPYDDADSTAPVILAAS